MSHYTAMKQLFPINLGEFADQKMQVKGAILDSVRLLIPELIAEMFPQTSTMFLQDWEKRYGIIPQSDASIHARRMAVRAKRLRKWGLSIPIYI